MEMKVTNLKVKVLDKEVTVSAPLSTVAKVAIINSTLDSDVMGTATKLSFDARTLVNMVQFYTDIVDIFPEVFGEVDIFAAYDILNSNGAFDTLLGAIEEISPGELDEFFGYADHARNEHQELLKSPAMAVLNTVEIVKDGILGMANPDTMEQLRMVADAFTKEFSKKED